MGFGPRTLTRPPTVAERRTTARGDRSGGPPRLLARDDRRGGVGSSPTRRCPPKVSRRGRVSPPPPSRPAYTCTLRLRSARVKPQRPKKLAHGKRASGRMGTVTLVVRCTQNAQVTLSGTVTERLGKKPRRGKSRTRRVHLTERPELSGYGWIARLSGWTARTENFEHASTAIVSRGAVTSGRSHRDSLRIRTRGRRRGVVSIANDAPPPRLTSTVGLGVVPNMSLVMRCPCDGSAAG
jgi:hypothetical protein